MAGAGLKNLKGAIQTLQAAEEMGKTEGVAAVGVQAAEAITDLLKDVSDGLEKAVADAGDSPSADNLNTLLTHVRGLSDELSGITESRTPEGYLIVNPQTQPADPNPSAEAERRMVEQKAAENLDAKTDKK